MGESIERCYRELIAKMNLFIQARIKMFANSIKNDQSVLSSFNTISRRMDEGFTRIKYRAVSLERGSVMRYECSDCHMQYSQFEYWDLPEIQIGVENDYCEHCGAGIGSSHLVMAYQCRSCGNTNIDYITEGD